MLTFDTVNNVTENTGKDEVYLWELFVNGNKQAFTDLYKLVYDKLYAYGLRFRIDDEYISDIIHEIFIKLYTKPERIKDPATIKAYLFMAFRNAYLNHSHYLQKHVGLHQTDSFDLQFKIEDTFLEDREEKENLRLRIEKILGSLTPRQREIIYLRFLHQMDYDEITKVMDLSGQAARNLIYRAIQSIRKNNTGGYILFMA